MMGRKLGNAGEIYDNLETRRETLEFEFTVKYSYAVPRSLGTKMSLFAVLSHRWGRNRRIPRPSFFSRGPSLRTKLFARPFSILLARGKLSWSSLTNSQKLAVEHLGWGKRQWNGIDHLSDLPAWNKLSLSQQAAVQHGLSLTKDEYELARRSLRNSHKQESQQSKSTSSMSQSISSSVASGKKLLSAIPSIPSMPKSLARAAWKAVQYVAPIVSNSPKTSRSIAALALESFPTLVDAMADKVCLEDRVETILYLDDSGSMHSKLGMGQSVLSSMASSLQVSTRVIKFGSKKTVLGVRDDSFSTSLTMFGWNAKSGSTYMWKMIEDDIMGRYKPAQNGKLRVVVITDGYDTDSPGPYNGIRGMDPMMKQLLAKRYDIEFHIVILEDPFSSFGSISIQDKHVRRYESLAAATGGSAVKISNIFHQDDPKVQSFLRTLEQSSRTGVLQQSQRVQRQQQYLDDARRGRKEHLDWVSLMPPPSSTKT